MNPVKTDRRVQRTRQLLRDSLIELILQKGYDAVTVQDITDHANLGRATFYLHYRDKEELLLQSLKETFDELAARISPMTPVALSEPSVPPAILAFQHAAEHRDLYRIMLSGQGAISVGRQIRAYLAGIIQQYIEHFIPANFPIPTEILAHHMAGSLIGLILWWLDSDMTLTPQQMADIFQELNVQALITRFGPKE